MLDGISMNKRMIEIDMKINGKTYYVEVDQHNIMQQIEQEEKFDRDSLYQVALLYSSPIVTECDGDFKKMYPELDTNKEFSWVNNFKYRMKCSKVCATMNNFTTLFNS